MQMARRYYVVLVLKMQMSGYMRIRSAKNMAAIAVLEVHQTFAQHMVVGKDAKKMAATRVLKVKQTFAQHMVVGKDAKKMAATRVL